MTKSFTLAILAAGAIAFGGCAQVRSPVTGCCYLDVSAGDGAAGSGALTSKVGVSKAVTYLGWFGMGDASVNTAAKAGGITKVAFVDYHSTQILGIIGNTETYVYGE